jgi:hypothetical protein
VNFWATDSEVVLEPTTVLVQGGADKDNLTHIAGLEVLTDPAFASVQSTIFARNLQQFDSEVSPLGESVAALINRKLDSVENFKCRWLKISMRRNALACIENSPLAARL